jgi:hypothetical protein
MSDDDKKWSTGGRTDPLQGQVVLYGCPPDWQRPYIGDPIPTIPQVPVSQPLYFADYDLRFRELMDELRTLRQALDRGLSEIREALAVTRVAKTDSTPKEKKPTLKASYRRRRSRGNQNVRTKRTR